MSVEKDTSKFSIEVGENSKLSVCSCCGKESNVGHGFIYKNGDAYAVYYAGWTPSHYDKRVSFAIAIGKWDDNSTVADRTCFGLEMREADEEILFRVIEPSESPWGNTDLLGKMISRQDTLSHSLIKEIFVIVEYIIHNHIAIRNYLGIPESLENQ